MKKILIASLVLGLGIFGCAKNENKKEEKAEETPIKTSCPKDSDVLKSLETLGAPSDAKIVALVPSKVAGLCEGVMKAGFGIQPFYISSDGNYIISGEIISLKDKKPLVDIDLSNYQKLSQDELKTLDSLTAFTYGNSQKYVYLILDPKHPPSIATAKMLKDFADKNKIAIKVIPFSVPAPPTPNSKQTQNWLYKGSFDEAASLYCSKDKNLYDEMLSGNVKPSSCKDGKDKEENTIKTLAQMHLPGIPVMVSEDGKYLMGAPKDISQLNPLLQ